MTGTRSWVVGFGLLVALPATAADFEQTWGAFVGTGVQVIAAPGADVAVGTVLSQAEVDWDATTGDWNFRVDLDYHFDPYFFTGGDNSEYTLAPHYPLPPEYAQVEWRPGKFFLRGGVTNPDMGLQEWDERDNYLPTYTSSWALQNGQNLGLEPGITFDDGTNLFAWGGYDLGFLTPAFGIGASTEQDDFGNWSGLFYMPAYRYGMLFTANEFYPLDALWVTVELNGGFVGPDIIGGAQVVANIVPEAPFGGAVRGEIMYYTDDAATELEIDVNRYALSGAFRIDAIPMTHLALEAKESWPRGGGDPYFTGTLYVSFGWTSAVEE